MLSKKLLQILCEVGLEDKQARVYLACLSLGPSTAQRIAHTAGVKRTTVYPVIEALKQRGLISVEVKGFKQRFVAAAPEKLESILERQRQNFLANLDQFSELYNVGGSEAMIRHYEGLEGVTAIYETLLEDVRPGDDYLIVSDVRQWFRLAPEFFSDFLTRRAKLPISVRVLLTREPDAQWYSDGAKRQRPNEKVKLLPATTKLSTNLVVIPKKVVIHQIVPPIMAMVIESRSIVQMHREFFELLWQSASEFESQ